MPINAHGLLVPRWVNDPAPPPHTLAGAARPAPGASQKASQLAPQSSQQVLRPRRQNPPPGLPPKQPARPITGQMRVRWLLHASQAPGIITRGGTAPLSLSNNQARREQELGGALGCAACSAGFGCCHVHLNPPNPHHKRPRRPTAKVLDTPQPRPGQPP